MIGLTILGDRNNSIPSVQQVLTLLRSEALALEWFVSGVEAVGPGAGAFHEVPENRSLSYDELYGLASNVIQVVDGEFIGVDTNGQKRLILRVVDSTSFDVEADSEPIIMCLETQFERTRRYDP
jgi:hypothetical protein